MALGVLSLLWVMAWALVALPAVAQQAAPALPPQEPILRIDPGMHTAQIRRLGVDAACKLMATGSYDKTIRLWRLPQGKLLRTLRPPIGPGHDGKVFAVAMAPDGSWVAAGGWDAAYSSAGSHFVYIFQASTGAMMARLGPVGGNVTTYLAVSPDGRYLAATLDNGDGLRVWERAGADLVSWRLVAEDRDYGGGGSFGAAFDRAGVFYTVADDGKLRRYGPDYRAKPAWVATREGKLPFSVAVHPSGDRVAVSYLDSTAVDIYDAATLAWRFAPDTNGLGNGNLWTVAWSASGEQLYAGGKFARSAGGVHMGAPVRVWERAGAGPAQELDGARHGVSHLLPCGDSMAIAALDPALGIIASSGRRRFWQESVQVDMRARRGEGGVSVAADGRRIRFALEEGGRNPILFDVAAEHLIDAPGQAIDLIEADTRGIPVTDWLDNPNPKLGGRAIKLEQQEMSHSLAVAADKQRFVLGAGGWLRGYDNDGKQLWRKQVPDIPWGVNVARDGRLVVAAYGDGTIRWHRLTDGEELLALFVHRLDRRWVAWTPKGYYMASPGAESLIGWHVNRGWDEAAQFYRVDRFRDQFNRPDIVKLALETLDEGKAIEEANKRAKVKRAVEDVRVIAPPSVVIQKPGHDTTFRTPEVIVEFDVFSPTGHKITKVDYLINNAALGARFVAPGGTGKFTFSGRVTLPLPPEDVTITLIAYEGTRPSEPASIRLRWDGAKPGQVALPRLRALLVGVNQYASPRLAKLDFAAKDATDLAAFFMAQEHKSYSKVELKALRDAKRLEVLDGLEWLEKGSEEGDINLLFLAGHGMTDERQHFYYMAADSDPDKARGTGVSRDELLRTIRNLKGTRVVMLDACHSGASADAAPAAPSRVDMNRLANEIGDNTLGVLLYASARGRQYSYERAEWGNGAFTRAVLDGLAGAADSGKLGYVETDELGVYVRRRVMAMTRGLQEPVRVKPDAAPEMKIVLLK